MKTEKVRKICLWVNIISLFAFEGYSMARGNPGKFQWDSVKEIPYIASFILLLFSQQIGAYAHQPLGEKGKRTMIETGKFELTVSLILPVLLLYVSIPDRFLQYSENEWCMLLTQPVIWISRLITLKYKWEEKAEKTVDSQKA